VPILANVNRSAYFREVIGKALRHSGSVACRFFYAKELTANRKRGTARKTDLRNFDFSYRSRAQTNVCASRPRRAKYQHSCVAKPYCDCLFAGNRFPQQSLTVRFLTFGVVTPVRGCSGWGAR
jgi:hypothetical protein